MADYRIRRAVAMMLVVLSIGTVVFGYLEDWSWVDSLYFTSITMTTIGYGDIYPTHDASKLFAVLFGIVSVTLLFYVIGIAVESRFHKKITEHISPLHPSWRQIPIWA